MATLPILYIDPRSARSQRAVRWLDGAGVDYRLKDVQADARAAAALKRHAPGVTPPALRWGPHLLQKFNRQQLVEFLWARGVTLEDS
jgi:hypothetical protein